MNQLYPYRNADEDSWINAESNSNGNPLMLRIRPDLQSFDGKESFPKKIVFTWEFGHTEERTGLPSHEQCDEMKLFEDALVESLEEGRCAIFAYSHTGCGLCERHFYISGLTEIQPALDAVLNGFPGLPLTIETYSDPEWSEYLTLAERMH